MDHNRKKVIIMSKGEWLLCPICGSKTRDRICQSMTRSKELTRR